MLQAEIKMNVVHVSWSFYNHSHYIGNVREEEHCILFSGFQRASGRPSQRRLWFLFSLFQHIRSILDVIYPPSSGVTKCYLTNYWLPSPSFPLHTWQTEDVSHGVYMCVYMCVCAEGVHWRGVCESHTDRLNQRERAFKQVVTCVYVASACIRWMTYLHLSVIALLWLKPLLIRPRLVGTVCIALLRTWAESPGFGGTFLFLYI